MAHTNNNEVAFNNYNSFEYCQPQPGNNLKYDNIDACVLNAHTEYNYNP